MTQWAPSNRPFLSYSVHCVQFILCMIMSCYDTWPWICCVVIWFNTIQEHAPNIFPNQIIFDHVIWNQLPHRDHGASVDPWEVWGPAEVNSFVRLVTQPWAQWVISTSRKWILLQGYWLTCFLSVLHEQLESDLSVWQGGTSPAEKMKKPPCMKLLLL